MGPRGWRRLKRLRILSQALFFAAFLYLFIRSLDPFAALENPFLGFDPLIFLTNPRALPPVILGVGGLLLLGLLLGRAFCGWICPLGSLAEALDLLLSPLRRRNPFPLTAPLLVRYPISLALLGASVVAAFAAPPVLQFLHPGIWMVRIASLTPLGLVFLGVLALLSLFARRLWCTHLCPLGALYGLLGRVSVFRLRIQSCSRCGRCDRCPTGAAQYRERRVLPHQCILCFDHEHSCPTGGFRLDAFRGRASAPRLRGGAAARQRRTEGEARRALRRQGREELLRSRRAFLAHSGQLLGGLAVGGLLGLSSRRRATALLRPPGVLDERLFLQRCLRCLQCVRSCPNGIIRITGRGHGLPSLFTPHLQFRPYGCDYYCQVCQQVCPNRAIPLQSLPDKQRTPVGLARIDELACVVYQKGINCLVCEEVCPLPEKAVRYELRESPGAEPLKLPKVVDSRCIGCGICEAKCPAEPLAIKVYPRKP
jgi:MauM/NapG family ferredoxin protein